MISDLTSKIMFMQTYTWTKWTISLYFHKPSIDLSFSCPNIRARSSISFHNLSFPRLKSSLTMIGNFTAYWSPVRGRPDTTTFQNLVRAFRSLCPIYLRSIPGVSQECKIRIRWIYFRPEMDCKIKSTSPSRDCRTRCGLSAWFQKTQNGEFSLT